MGEVQDEAPERAITRTRFNTSVSASSISAGSLSRIADRWLRWQCGLLTGVRYGLVIDLHSQPSNQVEIAAAVVASIGVPKPAVPLLKPLKKRHHCVTEAFGYWQIPIRCAGQTLCLVLQINPIAKPQSAAVDRLLRWGVLILKDWLCEVQSGVSSIAPPIQIMLSQNNLSQAAACWVDDLQLRSGASRVSVAWCSEKRTELIALSGVPALDVRRALSRSLAAVLQECVQAGESLSYPLYPEEVSTNKKSDVALDAHIHLHTHYGQHRLFSLPLAQADHTFGAVLLEFDDANNNPISVHSLVDEIAIVTPLLATMNERKASAVGFFKRGLRRSLQSLTRPTTTSQRCLTYTVLAGFIIALCFPFPQRVAIQGEIQGADRQVLAATHEAYLSQASARAGDVVTAGQVLAKFDDAQLQLERDTWVSELTQIDAAMVQAMTARDAAAIGRLRARQSAATAEVELIDHRLQHSSIVAPFDGVLVSGDLQDRLGSAVRTGEALFQIASLNDYQLQLDVPEHQAAKVAQGAVGTMRFAAFPSLAFEFTVQTMVPVAVMDDGKNVFRMQAALLGDTQEIRPGMSGVAKVLVGNRSWLMRVSDLVTQRLRYWWWSVGA